MQSLFRHAFGRPNREQREWLLLSSACLLKVAAGQTVAGPVYANSMRAVFDLNQSQLNVSMAMLYTGQVFSFICGLIFDRCGPRNVVAIGGIASTIGSLCIALAFAFPDPLRHRPVALWFLLFVYGHTFNYAEVAATSAAMRGFPSDRRGRVMSALDNCFTLGAPLSALVHYLLFANISRPPDEQSAVGTLAVQTVFTAVVHAFAFVFIHQPSLNATASESYAVLPLGERTPILAADAATGGGSSESEDGMSKELTDDQDDDSEDLIDEFESAQSRESTSEFLRSTCVSCLSWPVALLLWGYGFGMAQTLAVWLNTTTVTRSLGLSSEDVKYFWVPWILGFLWRCLLGPVSDHCCVAPHLRATVVAVFITVFGTPAVLLVTLPLPEIRAVLMAGTLSSYCLTALLVATLFTFGPVLLSQTTSPRLFGRLYSACILLGTAISVPLSLQSGLIYDRMATGGEGGANGTAVCLGQDCYRQGNVANTASQFASTACLTALAALLWHRTRGGA